MAKITIVTIDKRVTVDDFTQTNVDVSGLPNNVWAIQFDNTANTGHIEYNDGTANETITSLTSAMTTLVNANKAAKTAEDDDIASKESTADAEKTTEENKYSWKRANEYPSIVDQLDDIYHNGIDGWKATIKTTKDKYPK